MNFIYGQNGVGKTSVLEAIYMLSTGHSFRSRMARHLIQNGAESLTLFAAGHGQTGDKHTFGIQKTKSSSTFQLDGERDVSSSAMAALLPVLLINSESFNLLCGEPSYRRQRIDWGVFHVEHSFYQHWRCYHQALKQRNKLLQEGQFSEINHWNHVLIEHGEKIGAQHRAYLEKFCTKLSTLAYRWFHVEHLELLYQQGWPEEISFKEALLANFTKDAARGFTQVGPHRSDLKIKIEGMMAKDRLSRGQLKRFVLLMYIAQAEILIEESRGAKQPILLLDDFESELDSTNQVVIAELLSILGCQCFVTSIEKDFWTLWQPFMQKDTDKLFSVEQVLDHA
jgi:DNA replication and repair protein RecF